jgi:O-antigen/teichoic acid export membrane protein
MAASAPTPRPLTAGAIRSGLSQLVTAAGGGLTTLLVARILGAAGAGVYAVAMTLMLGLMTLATLSLQNGVSVLVASGKWAPRQALRETQLAAAGLGLVAVGVGVGLNYGAHSAFRGLDLALMLVTSLSVPFALSWTYASSVALAVDHYELYALPPAMQSCLGLIVVPALAATSGISGAIVGLAASQVVTAVVTLVWTARVLSHDDQHRDADASALRAAIVFGVKTHLSNVLAFFNYRLDLFILNATASASQVGEYSIAVSVTQMIWLLPRALNAVVTPRVARAHGRRSELGTEYLELVEGKSLRHTTLLVIGSAAAVALALVVLVVGFLGPKFYESITLGMILLPGSGLLALVGSLTAVAIGRGRPDYSLWGALLTTPVAVGLYVALVPPFDAVGAAVASSLAYAVGFGIAVVLYRRMIGPRPLRLLVPRRSDLADYRGLIPRRFTRKPRASAR